MTNATEPRLRVFYGNVGRHEITRVYDDGAGPVWVYFESLGPVGAVRAATWEDAYSICEDVIFDDADPSDPDTYARSYDETAEEGELAECHGYRNNGPAGENGLTSHIYQTDHNGSFLYRADSAECKRWGVTVELPPSEDE